MEDVRKQIEDIKALRLAILESRASEDAQDKKELSLEEKAEVIKKVFGFPVYIVE